MKRVLVAAALFVAAFGCGAPPSQSTLQVISPHWQGIEDEFGAAFESYWKNQTGEDIKVVWRDMGGTSDDLRWIKSEFEKRPEAIDLDIFFGGGIDPYRQLKSLGVLQQYTPPEDILSAIPQEMHGVALYDGDHYWYGTAISGFGVVYNKPLVKQIGAAEPATWADLADTKFFTWVGTGDPRHSGTVHMMYEIILQAYGWESGWQIITAMAGNTREIVQNSGDIPLSVAKGQIAAGTAIDFYAWTQVDQVGADTIGFVMPEGLTVVNPDSIAILKGAPNLPAAKAFIDFVLSEAGQKLWYLKAGAPGGPAKNSLLRMPVRRDLYEKYAADSPVRMNPFAQSQAFTYDAALGTRRYEALNDLVGATIVDCHGPLVDAWKALINAGLTESALPALAKPPVTQDELDDLAAGDLADPVKRNDTIAKWVAYARDKYARMTE